jgi:hypothetical protein
MSPGCEARRHGRGLTRCYPNSLGGEEPTAEYEKLGAFYLGRGYDLENSRVGDEDLLYDAKDLTTHVVCLGMTGSGKTELCVTLPEEAALDGIPAIAIDPKGDLGNLLLNFPKLRPADFLPWVDPAEAARDGRTLQEHAQRTAVRGASRAARERGDVARARDDVEALQQQLRELEAEFEERLEEVRDQLDDSNEVCQELAIRPRKAELTVERVALVWTPWRVGADGIAEPEF